MTKFIKELITELEFNLNYEINNRTETNYNGLGIATAKRRLETAKEALFMYEAGELTITETEIMVMNELYK